MAVPTVSTSAVSSKTSTSFNAGGNVTNDGGKTVTARGIIYYWSAWNNGYCSELSMSVKQGITSNGTGTGSFSSSVSSLPAGTHYYHYRAYATNSDGTGYGSIIQVTLTEVLTPTVRTNSVNNITYTGATCTATCLVGDSGHVYGVGICWSASTNPIINPGNPYYWYPNQKRDYGRSNWAMCNSKTYYQNSGELYSAWTGNTATLQITGLTPNTTYYVRGWAYEQETVGGVTTYYVGYGDNVSFTTLSDIPTLSTTAISNIGCGTASGGGNITASGSNPVTARGVCWSTGSTPTIANNHTHDGTGTGSFTSTLTGLSYNTTYYVRAYATNAIGTAYGSEVSFTTITGKASVSTNTITSITATGATGGGNVTLSGCSAVTARGICWNTGGTPTTGDTHTTQTGTTGSFTSTITGLTSGTSYFVRAYAVNSYGIIYGNQESFTTLVPYSNWFETTWDTTKTSVGSSNNNQVKLPLISVGTYNFHVYWGDGNDDIITSWNQAEATHTYASTGIYDISISGTCRGWAFRNTGDKLKLLEISKFGDLIIIDTTTQEGMFHGCKNMDITATDIPDVSTVTYFGNMFADCNNLVFNSSINNWDTHSMTDMQTMFYKCYKFNQPLSNWVTSAVTVTWYTFANCRVFNQSLNTWDTSNMTGFGAMFSGCWAYNQPMDNWDTSGANPVNDNNFYSMFQNCYVFNQDISNFDVSAGKNFNYMFQDARAFNQDISGWDLSNAQNMSYMFYNANAFNQDISSWNISGVTNMSYAFYDADVFNQDLGSWDFTNVSGSTLSQTFRYTAISRDNYDSLLYNWAHNDVATGVTFYLGQNYCDFISHNTLDTTKSWTFHDNGFSSSCPDISPSGLTGVLNANCGIDFTWTNNGIYDWLLLENYGSWNSVVSLAGDATGYTWNTPTPTSNIFRITGYIGTYSFNGASTPCEIPLELHNVIKKPAQCGGFGSGPGRIIWTVDNFITGHTYSFEVYNSKSELYYYQTGITANTQFYIYDVPPDFYTAIITDTTCGCSVNVGSTEATANNFYTVTGIQRLFITPWSATTSYNYYSNSDDDWYINGLDTLQFTSTKIKEYIDIADFWYEIRLNTASMSYSEALQKDQNGLTYNEQIAISIPRQDNAKWKQLVNILTQRYIVVFQDNHDNFWTCGYRAGMEVKSYSLNGNTYIITFIGPSVNKMLTAIDENYVKLHIL